jgi:hypothetical protein
MLPLAIAGAALGLGQMYGAYLNYEAAKDWRRDSYRASARSILGGLRDTYGALSTRRVQEHEAASLALQQITDESMMGVGAITTAAAEGGVGGNAVASLISDFQRQEMQRQQIVLLNLEWRDRQLFEESRAAKTQAYQGLLGAIGAPIQKPDYLGMFAKMFGNVAGAGVGGGGG